MTSTWVTALAVLVLNLCDSLIVEHHFDEGLAPFSYQTFTEVAMYSPKDAPQKSKPGNGKSFIKFELDIERSENEAQASLELIIIPDTNINDIGTHFNGDLRICCDQDMIDAGICNAKLMNKLIINKYVKETRFQIDFEAGQSLYKLDKVFDVKETAIYVFGLAICNEASGTITFKGKTVWMNPYGHLPGDVYGCLPFYACMCVVYLIIGSIWFYFNATDGQQLLHVQNCITGVLLLSIIEMATWYFHYLDLNTTGAPYHEEFILGIVTTVSRRMIARMLILAVSMGYGIVKPTLGPVRNKIVILECVHWIFAFMFEALVHYHQTELKVKAWMKVVLILVVVILNGIFWCWTFVSLKRTIKYLKTNNQLAKLKLYHYFTFILAITFIVAITLAVYHIFYIEQQLYLTEWKIQWLLEAGCWQILFSIILFSIMILWCLSDSEKLLN